MKVKVNGVEYEATLCLVKSGDRDWAVYGFSDCKEFGISQATNHGYEIVAVNRCKDKHTGLVYELKLEGE